MELFEKQDKQCYEGKLKRTNGEVRDVIFDKASLHDTTGIVTGLVGVISDITERKHAEDLVRDLSQRLMQAQECERQMISCELHDSIAQNLSTLKLYCSRLFKALSSPESDIKALSADASNLLDQTITAVRDMAYDLRPPSLDHMGLVSALDVFCEEFAEKNDILVDFQAAGIHESILTSGTQINLYRLVMEGLNNIRKHAVAAKATIRLVGAYPNIILRIEDNGKGFDVKERERSIVNEKRMGLRSMKERVNLLQGRMSILSQLNKGTQIVITLPLKDNPKWIKKSAF
jgi:signal transduction histidine kinase